MRLTLMPRASRRQPIEAAASPLPSEDTTPPVTKMDFADMSATSLDDFWICAWCARLSIAGSGGRGKYNRDYDLIKSPAGAEKANRLFMRRNGFSMMRKLTTAAPVLKAR